VFRIASFEKIPLSAEFNLVSELLFTEISVLGMISLEMLNMLNLQDSWRNSFEMERITAIFFTCQRWPHPNRLSCCSIGRKASGSRA